ncbi:MAG: NAD-dependent epimerase/dehydratase family protein [Terrimicrobiaceae bacterium]|nr:NAD-dependent epimerase/dehydratase family protein [Terrimicrobiaceae bacterium]
MAAAPSSLFVFLSTGAVYGNTGPVPADEARPPAPLGAYARGKLAAEELLSRRAHERSLILRVGNLLGERAEPSRPQGILPRLIEAARTGRPAEVWGDGEAAKDYLHCADFCEALLRLISCRAKGVFNVGTGATHTVNELIGCVERISGRQVPRLHRPPFPWDVREGRLDCRKLAGTVNWKPLRSLEDAVRESWRAC